MRTITVYFDDGDKLTTSINGSDPEIAQHYLGTRFEAGDDTKHHVAILVHFHDTDRRIGLTCVNIESGSTGQVQDVRRETVKIDDDNSFEEVVIKTQSSEYSTQDLWFYDLRGHHIPTIGYRSNSVER